MWEFKSFFIILLAQLVADVFSHSLGEAFESLIDVKNYADLNPERFLASVDAARLFVAPGGSVEEPLADALNRYQREIETWRSEEWLRLYARLPTHLRVFNGITERLGPIYHLLENSEEMKGHPLMCLEQHAHYFKLISSTNSARLENLGLLDHRTRALIDALSSRRLQWLGGLPIATLARLRQDNEHVAFRKRLKDAVGQLHDSMLSNIDDVTAESCHELSSAIADYERQLKGVQRRYNRMHGQTAVLAIAAAGAALVPALAPFLGSAAPFALAAKYGRDKVEELAEKRCLSQSLIGVLATARES
jgi:hypothetical protein